MVTEETDVVGDAGSQRKKVSVANYSCYFGVFTCSDQNADMPDRSNCLCTLYYSNGKVCIYLFAVVILMAFV